MERRFPSMISLLRRTAFLLTGALCLAVLLGDVSVSTVRATPLQMVDDTSNTPESVLDAPFVREEGARGLSLLYNMKFDEARAIFDEIDARYPNHPVGPFLKGLNIWWKILIDLPDTSHDDAFYSAMDETIARCEEILDEDPDNFDATFFKGAAMGFRGRLRSNRGDWFKATLDGKRAIGYVREVAERDPDNPDFLFGKGMYDYYAAIIPKEYPVSKAIMWMMPSGDRERGIRLISESATRGHYIQTEAIYFLAQIYFLYEEDYQKAMQYTEQLREMHDANPYFHNFHGRVLARWGRWSKAASVFSEVVDRHADGQAGYNRHIAEVARFYLARERLYRREYDDALMHLAELEALTTQEGVTDTRYRVLGYLYQGMAFDGLGERDMAKSRYNMVFRFDDYANAHERAERYLDSPYGQ
jgi:tetratricopeptide (TPR) repeat protein